MKKSIKFEQINNNIAKIGDFIGHLDDPDYFGIVISVVDKGYEAIDLDTGQEGFIYKDNAILLNGKLIIEQYPDEDETAYM